MEETPAVSSQSHVATLNFSVYWVFANAVRSFKGIFNTHDSPSPAWSGDPFGIHDEASIWIGYPISNLTARSFQWAWSYEFFCSLKVHIGRRTKVILRSKYVHILEIERGWHVSPFLELASQKNTLKYTCKYNLDIPKCINIWILDLLRCFEHTENE